MRALSFYLLVNVMALMETVSAQEERKPNVLLVDKTWKRVEMYSDDCVKVEKGMIAYYDFPVICQYFTDITCKNFTSDPSVYHDSGENDFLKNPKGYMQCIRLPS
ncbi:hypothetical protein [Absidia glauca]|uniref:Uncharacterized protein n=1 Tax=Absidia glauca TaxID=4829 RepID=A0A168KUM2_ABSGL|nr:hypothetical protein [Absidia glauca]